MSKKYLLKAELVLKLDFLFFFTGLNSSLKPNMYLPQMDSLDYSEAIFSVS